MPRLTPITKREQVSGDALTAFDAIIESRNSINGPHSMMMYAPEVARCSTALSDALRFGGNLPDHDTELAIITAARHWIANMYGPLIPPRRCGRGLGLRR